MIQLVLVVILCLGYLGLIMVIGTDLYHDWKP